MSLSSSIIQKSYDDWAPLVIYFKKKQNTHLQTFFTVIRKTFAIYCKREKL